VSLHPSRLGAARGILRASKILSQPAVLPARMCVPRLTKLCSAVADRRERFTSAILQHISCSLVLTFYCLFLLSFPLYLFTPLHSLFESRHSDWLRVEDREVGLRVPVGSNIFFSPRRPGRIWGPPSLLSNGYWGLFPRG
jgi:hypothetical protein